MCRVAWKSRLLGALVLVFPRSHDLRNYSRSSCDPRSRRGRRSFSVSFGLFVRGRGSTIRAVRALLVFVGALTSWQVLHRENFVRACTAYIISDVRSPAKDNKGLDSKIQFFFTVIVNELNRDRKIIPDLKTHKKNWKVSRVWLFLYVEREIYKI